ncbi:hypothetical protein [Brucella sp. 63/311]|uniref:hypothetical protein n=1 Tax=Brucella sp. 63/311 TaxID=1160235 RepID=UPI0002CE1CC6|nr:hypothetical protein [Brucella sp. 63/311]ENT05967.1 hypothetical protein C038_00895 [Brucella sp. 63/311]
MRRFGCLSLVASLEDGRFAPLNFASRRFAYREERYRRNKASQVTQSDATEEIQKEGFPHTPSEENTPKEKTPKGVQKKSPRSVLEAVLSQPIAVAVVEHRAKIKKPLTERGAELLAKRLAAAKDACGLTADQAADLMIERGWQGFDAEWAKHAMQSGWKPEAQQQASSYKPDSELSQEERDARWKKFMNYARNNRCWHSDVWGPMPNMLGCRVLAHLILPTDGRKSNGDPWTEQGRIAA